VDRKTLDRLREHGEFGESYKKVVNRLLDMADDLECDPDEEQDEV